VTELVEKIRETRKALNEQEDIQPHMTDLEHECFKACLAILKSHIGNMGSMVINRLAAPAFVGVVNTFFPANTV